ncbi:37545_t:CDS:2 [Gigaspora margarita]|uniref:37545_t:CDS:1 n=1 Tax=Gigaspora margarita TaxID=4874 RepID=A0ABN7UMT6_GIGMA|nr:37545_t:CDS:2 [Gigaspora margarita]
MGKYKGTHFPVSLAFAMTINKSQGQSLSRVGLDLTTPIFTHGQLYVALSRTTSKQNLKIITNNDKRTKNIVYTKILH